MFALGVTDPNTQWDIGDATLHLTARGFDTLAATLGSDPATGATGYLLKDHLGSTRSLYSASKSPLAHLEYTPYGEIHTNLGITTQADITPTFTGKPYDHETRLYYFPYRYYNPQNARWISRDPLGMVDGPNMYAYVGNNPLGFADLFGLYKWKCKKSRSDTWCRIRLGVPDRDGCQKLCCHKIKPSCQDNAEAEYWKAIKGECAQALTKNERDQCKFEKYQLYKEQMVECGVSNAKEPKK